MILAYAGLFFVAGVSLWIGGSWFDPWESVHKQNRRALARELGPIIALMALFVAVMQALGGLIH